MHWVELTSIQEKVTSLQEKGVEPELWCVVRWCTAAWVVTVKKMEQTRDCRHGPTRSSTSGKMTRDETAKHGPRRGRVGRVGDRRRAGVCLRKEWTSVWYGNTSMGEMGRTRSGRTWSGGRTCLWEESWPGPMVVGVHLGNIGSSP